MIIYRLEPSLGRRESVATARLLLEDVLGVTPAVLLTRGEREVEPETVARFEKMTDRIASGEPPQYVTGRAHFMGMDLKVTSATLIPRPETAELVDLVTEYAKGRRDLSVLDIGTGSGCIAIALARALPFADVKATDISRDALDVAAENARTMKVKITFDLRDVLDVDAMKGLDGPFDIIVSNPPYIAQSERDDMESRVKDYEPAQALFVYDSDPLVYYRAIVDYAVDTRQPATLFFEINPIYASDLKKMMEAQGYDCDLRRDSFSKERFILGVRR